MGAWLERSRPRLLWWSLGTPRSCEGDVDQDSPQLKEYEEKSLRCEKSDASASVSAYLEKRVDV